MAAHDPKTSSDDGKSSDYNPKLDFFSEHFDPLLALKTPDLIIPVSDAKTYDNLNFFNDKGEVRSNIRGPSGKKNVQEGDNTGQSERRWLPHQMPIKSEKRINLRNVFTKMDKMEGPLQLLRACKEKRLRIKVWTRGSHGIRGFCLGFVVVFDKHWNLALEDVDELWTRPKRRKVPALDGGQDLGIKPKVLPPQIEIVKSTKKTETCCRHVDQLMMRGEQIAFIVVLSDKEQSADVRNMLFANLLLNT